MPNAPKTVRLFQNCLTSTHSSHLIPGFEALDFRENPHPEWREFQIFEYIYQNGMHCSADILGAVSSRFEAKGLIDGYEVRRWIEADPGKDVYIANPWPQSSYANFNVNTRDSIIHDEPAFSTYCQRVLDLAGVPLNYESIGRQHNGNHGMCSYWFGSPRFWEKIVTELVVPVIHLSRLELGPELHDFLYKPITYFGQADHRPGGLPFLLERATSLYIQAEFSASAAFYQRTREQILDCCLFPFERDLIVNFGDQVDVWDATAQYGPQAMEYFHAALLHFAHGSLTYMNRHPVDFDHGNPRPRLPWFRNVSEHHPKASREMAAVR